MSIDLMENTVIIWEKEKEDFDLNSFEVYFDSVHWYSLGILDFVLLRWGVVGAVEGHKPKEWKICEYFVNRIITFNYNSHWQ